MTNEEIEKAIESGETRNVFAAKITQAKYQQVTFLFFVCVCVFVKIISVVVLTCRKLKMH